EYYCWLYYSGTWVF
nr:immunoglobulin light chain junction region [Macaca mulatta]MOX70936.1 immunoglobulin light chain junction region [Macaca mulatta]MOX74092.1 immunoglobulin light chain junction region [Macaca mulatta]